MDTCIEQAHGHMPVCLLIANMHEQTMDSVY
jgi:hypothetical protein